MSPKRKEIFREGRRRQNLVRVVEGTHRGAVVYWVLYRVGPAKKEALFPRTRAGRKEALAFARGIRDAQPKPGAKLPPPTVEQLFRRFCEENDPELRDNTRRIYRETWSHWENFVGPHTVAQDCTRENMVKLRTYLEVDRRPPLATNTVRRIMVTVRHVYRWAEDAEIIPASRVLRYVYRVAKDRRPVPPAEYRMEEFLKIAEQCGLETERWRAGAVLRLCCYQGKRQWQVVHLDWSDVDWTADELRWRPEWEKMGKDERQPMRRPTRAVLEMLWHRAERPASGWVFPAARKHAKSPVYTVQSVWTVLQATERAAGVEKKEGRGGHGLRRLLSGEVAALTGNIKLALDAIGDSDIRQASRYVQRRMDRLRETFDQLDVQLETAAQLRTKDVQADSAGKGGA